METRFAEQKVRRDLMQWGQHQAAPIQARCMAIAFDLTCLASNPDNLTLRRDTMKRIASLEEEVRTQNTTSTGGYRSGNDKPPTPQHEPERRPLGMGPIVSPVLAFVLGFLLIIYWNSTGAYISDPNAPSSAGPVQLRHQPVESSWLKAAPPSTRLLGTNG